ncbi:MAG TPA: prepilin-type N-terminal cleavage/methylation domain-containing protein [Calidithermus sp.]|nr:prepilin-type N-terminal cleavage/methylation domain-containing protein [Calidithermus sp.]
MSDRAPRGFTLLEVLIALAIVASLVAIAFGGLRVAVAAWDQGQDRAEVHQHLRGVTMLLDRALAAAYPYRAPLGQAPEPVVLFRGEPARLEFVTGAPPLPPAVPVAFTAVVLALERDDPPALVVRQRVLPNRDPFADAAVILRDPEVSRLAFRYLDGAGVWQDEWDAEARGGLPQAVQVSVAVTHRGRTQALPPLTVTLRTAQP